MASPSLPTCFFLSFLIAALYTHCTKAQVEDTFSLQLTMDSPLEWPPSTANSMYDLDGEMGSEDGDVYGTMMTMGERRELYWRMHYYISYGALSANRIPCPPRSGRSYYTHNCYKATGPAHPYIRGCSRITLCRY
ncbi:hypothetical protein ACLOJK_033125 [Asimina triloba]